MIITIIYIYIYTHIQASSGRAWRRGRAGALPGSRRGRRATPPTPWSAARR